jgi:hypothetical protein
MYGLVLGIRKVIRLKIDDQDIRGAIKYILRLHPSTAHSLIYARKRDRGMGIPRSAKLVHFANLMSRLALLPIGGEAVHATSMTDVLKDHCRKIASAMRLN